MCVPSLPDPSHKRESGVGRGEEGMRTSIKQCLVNRRLNSGKTQLKQTQFHPSSPFSSLRLESHSFSQYHELEHLYKCPSLILWSDLATSPSGFPTTLPLVPISPETLAFWPWYMPAVFPHQMFWLSCSLSVLLSPRACACLISCLFLIVPSPPSYVKHSISSPDLGLSTPILSFIVLLYHLPLFDNICLVFCLLSYIRMYIPWRQRLCPFYSLLYFQHIEQCLVHSKYSKNSYCVNE